MRSDRSLPAGKCLHADVQLSFLRSGPILHAVAEIVALCRTCGAELDRKKMTRGESAARSKVE